MRRDPRAWSSGQFLLRGLRARDVLRLRQQEVVRRVTALTGDTGVKVVLGRSNLVTTAATLGERVFFRARRVRFMAGNACPASAAPDDPNARSSGTSHTRQFGSLRTSCGAWYPHEGVRTRVAASATTFAWQERQSTARFALELVRPVAADALRVTAGDQCRRWHDGLSLAVTFGTRGERASEAERVDGCVCGRSCTRRSGPCRLRRGWCGCLRGSSLRKPRIPASDPDAVAVTAQAGAGGVHGTGPGSCPV